MKATAKMLSALVACALCLQVLLGGCATTAAAPKNTFIGQAVWTGRTKDKAYAACLTALQTQGFKLHPLSTSKESGIIVAGRERLLLVGDCTGFYKLQILVSELARERIMASLNVKAWYKVGPAWVTTEPCRNC